MNKLVALIICLLSLSGCFAQRYHVDYDGEMDFYEGAKESYRVGERVDLYYDLIATDTDYTFLLDGESINFSYSDDRGFEISFVMPDHDVKLECVTRNTMTALPGDIIFPRYDTPVSVRYDRMWVYGAYAETDDPEVIGALVEAIRALEPGGYSNLVTEDYTDILTFCFDDGTELRIEFENQCWVDGELRQEVEGLGAVRAILDEMLAGEASD